MRKVEEISDHHRTWASTTAPTLSDDMATTWSRSTTDTRWHCAADAVPSRSDTGASVSHARSVFDVSGTTWKVLVKTESVGSAVTTTAGRTSAGGPVRAVELCRPR